MLDGRDQNHHSSRALAWTHQGVSSGAWKVEDEHAHPGSLVPPTMTDSPCLGDEDRKPLEAHGVGEEPGRRPPRSAPAELPSSFTRQLLELT